MKQRWYNFVTTLCNIVLTSYQRRAPTLYIKVIQRLKYMVRFCFIFNVGSTLFERWPTTLKQLLSDVEMLAGSKWLATKIEWTSGNFCGCFFYIYLFHHKLEEAILSMKIASTETLRISKAWGKVRQISNSHWSQGLYNSQIYAFCNSGVITDHTFMPISYKSCGFYWFN